MCLALLKATRSMPCLLEAFSRADLTINDINNNNNNSNNKNNDNNTNNNNNNNSNDDDDVYAQ